MLKPSSFYVVNFALRFQQLGWYTFSLSISSIRLSTSPFHIFSTKPRWHCLHHHRFACDHSSTPIPMPTANHTHIRMMRRKLKRCERFSSIFPRSSYARDEREQRGTCASRTVKEGRASRNGRGKGASNECCLLSNMFRDGYAAAGLRLLPAGVLFRESTLHVIELVHLMTFFSGRYYIYRQYVIWPPSLNFILVVQYLVPTLDISLQAHRVRSKTIQETIRPLLDLTSSI